MIRNRHSAAVLFLVLYLVTASSANSAEEDTVEAKDEKDSSSWASQDDSSSTLYKLEKKNDNYLLQLKTTATDKKYTGKDTDTVGLEALLGQLFAPGTEGKKGYYFLSGKIRSDSTQRFNATLGYFPPFIGGELKLTYRLLHSGVFQDMPITGEFDKNALEQGVALYYKKYSKILIKEFAFNYAFTHMNGESDVTDPYTVETPFTWEQNEAIRGFGDTETHTALAELALGSDKLDIPFLEGYRWDLGGGYQRVTYGEFYDISEITDEGIVGTTRIQFCTPIGVLTGSYEHTPASDTNYGGYRLGGLEAYYRKTNYEHSDVQETIGLNLTFDLLNPGSFFDTSCMPFFHSSTEGYTSTSQMSHIGLLSSDEFKAQKVNQIIRGIYKVNKTGLSDKVRIDTSGDSPRLMVTTNCQQINLGSVNPPSAASAFNLNGNEIYISLAGLPTDGQTVVATINDACCGDTRVTVATSPGSLAVDGVDVMEGVGCIQRQPDGSPCTTASQCLSGVCGSTGTCGGDLRDACTVDSQCKTGSCGSSGTCGGDIRDTCTVDSQCKTGLCGSSGTCGGDIRDTCTVDSQCKVGVCGTSGTCGGDTRDPCSANTQCKVGVCGSSGTCGGDMMDPCTGANQCKINVCGTSGTCGGDFYDPCTANNECKAARCGSSGTCGGDPYDSCTVNSECKSSNCAPIATPPAPLQCF